MAEEVDPATRAAGDFLKSLYAAINDEMESKTRQLYEVEFISVSKRFSERPWPTAEEMAPLVDADSVFLLLYKQLYFRHIYMTLTPTAEQRFASWDNYKELLDIVIEDPTLMELALPREWVWDMLDELLYQFRLFQQWRASSTLSDAERALIAASPDAWSAPSVLALLHGLIRVTKIKSILAGEVGDDDPRGPRKLTFGERLGYYSLIALTRMNCLLGDYHAALAAVAAIDLSDRNGRFTAVLAAHVTLFYYVGFAYLMAQRPADTVRVYSSVLLLLSRTLQFHAASYQHAALSKKSAQMMALLAIAHALAPSQEVNEQVAQQLREKHGDLPARLLRGCSAADLAAFDDLFAYGAPKLLSTSGASGEGGGADATKLRAATFRRTLRRQTTLAASRSYLKLYTTVSIDKLASLRDGDAGRQREALLALKQQARSLCWTAAGDGTAPAASGDWLIAPALHFSVAGDVVTTDPADDGPADFSAAFISRIGKLAGITKSLS
eukprot:PLAT9210.1.p2 GENE.PLAT9210.1~~PLAT9210.1.p2  ORF type:complete len:497 (+),score=310.31 PLAT9210.1:20-1510(+)